MENTAGEKNRQIAYAALFLFTGGFLLSYDFMGIEVTNYYRSHLNLGYAYSKNKKYDKAIEEAKSSLKMAPENDLGNADIHSLLATLYREKEEYEKATVQAKKALKYFHDFARAYNTLGAVEMDKNNYDKAIEYFSKAEKNAVMKLTKYEAHYNLGLAYERKGMYGIARHEYEKAGNSYSYEKGHLSIIEGLDLVQKGKYDEAILKYKEALKVNPDEPIIYNNIGQAYGRKGLNKKSIEFFNRALTLDKNFADTYYYLGVAYGVMRNFVKARNFFEKAILLDESRYNFHFDLGLAYLNLNKHKKAIQHLKRSIELNPDNLNAFGSLGSIYTKMGKKESAIRMFEMVLAIDPGHKIAEGEIEKLKTK